MAVELALRFKPVIHELLHHVFGISQRNQTVCNGSRRAAQFTSESAGASSVVGNRNYGADIGGVMLQAAEEVWQTASAANDRDFRTRSKYPFHIKRV